MCPRRLSLIGKTSIMDRARNSLRARKDSKGEDSHSPDDRDANGGGDAAYHAGCGAGDVYSRMNDGFDGWDG